MYMDWLDTELLHSYIREPRDEKLEMCNMYHAEILQCCGTRLVRMTTHHTVAIDGHSLTIEQKSGLVVKHRHLTMSNAQSRWRLHEPISHHGITTCYAHYLTFKSYSWNSSNQFNGTLVLSADSSTWSLNDNPWLVSVKQKVQSLYVWELALRPSK